jgi:tRNA(Arg) A34 adenosine deaminase TadA
MSHEEIQTSDFRQLSLPVEHELNMLLYAEQIRKDKQLEALFPTLQQNFSALMFAQYYFFTSKELGGTTPEFPIGAFLLGSDRTALPLLADTNKTNDHHNSLDHAEKVVIEKALERTGDKHLPKGTILYSMVEPCAMCTSAFIHAGGDTIIFSASQDEMRNMTFDINGEIKDFRAEPHEYSSEEFATARNPQIKVFGGYRKFDVLKFFQYWQEDYIAIHGKGEGTFSLHEV